MTQLDSLFKIADKSKTEDERLISTVNMLGQIGIKYLDADTDKSIIATLIVARGERVSHIAMFKMLDSFSKLNNKMRLVRKDTAITMSVFPPTVEEFQQLHGNCYDDDHPPVPCRVDERLIKDMITFVSARKNNVLLQSAEPSDMLAISMGAQAGQQQTHQMRQMMAQGNPMMQMMQMAAQMMNMSQMNMDDPSTQQRSSQINFLGRSSRARRALTIADGSFGAPDTSDETAHDGAPPSAAGPKAAHAAATGDDDVCGDGGSAGIDGADGGNAEDAIDKMLDGIKKPAMKDDTTKNAMKKKQMQKQKQNPHHAQ